MDLMYWALAGLGDTLAIRESLPDDCVIDRAELLCTLADLYVETDRMTEADAVIHRAQELIDGRVTATHLIHARISEMLGCIRHAAADFDGANGHFEHALAVREKVQPPDHPQLSQLLDAHARSLAAAGDAEKAAEQIARAEQIRELHRETEHAEP